MRINSFLGRFLLFVSLISSGIIYAENEKKEVNRLHALRQSYIKDGNFLGYISLGKGTRQSLGVEGLVFSCLQSYNRFKDLMNKSDENLWKAYKDSVPNLMTVTFKDNMADIKSITPVDETRFKVTYNSNSDFIEVLKYGDKYYFDFETIHKDKESGLGNMFLFKRMIDSGINFLTPSCKEKFSAYDIKKTMELSHGVSKELLNFKPSNNAYLITQETHTLSVADSRKNESVSRSSYIAVLDFQDGENCDITVYGIENYNFLKQQCEDFTFKVKVDAFGNIVKITENQNLNNHQSYASLLITTQCFLPMPNDDVYPSEFWKIKRQGYEEEDGNYFLIPPKLYNMDNIQIIEGRKIANISACNVLSLKNNIQERERKTSFDIDKNQLLKNQCSIILNTTKNKGDKRLVRSSIVTQLLDKKINIKDIMNQYPFSSNTNPNPQTP